jgi:rubrerythrin
MDRLISLQAAIEKMEALADDDNLTPDEARSLSWCIRAIESLPTVSAQPEQKKGEWINRSLNILYPEWERYTCSVCGKHSYNYDFCPNCGARMRRDDNL